MAFLRCELRDADAARDLAHEFFAEMLGGGAIAHADQERGRFRSYLLGAVKHFLSHHREAARRLKRGGGVETFRSMTPTPARPGRWRTRACCRPTRPSTGNGRSPCWRARSKRSGGNASPKDARSFFEQVKPWLTGDAAHGDQTALAAACGMNADALKVAVHRLKRRFRQLLKAEVAGTLDDPGQVEAEMHALFAALGG